MGNQCHIIAEIEPVPSIAVRCYLVEDASGSLDRYAQVGVADAAVSIDARRRRCEAIVSATERVTMQ